MRYFDHYLYLIINDTIALTSFSIATVFLLLAVRAVLHSFNRTRTPYPFR